MWYANKPTTPTLEPVAAYGHLPSDLIVDDESGIVEVVARMLEEIGYPVESAGNGAEALAIIERVHPAPVLLDMRMPVLDG